MCHAFPVCIRTENQDQATCFTILVRMRFLFLISSPRDILVLLQLMCRPCQTLHFESLFRKQPSKRTLENQTSLLRCGFLFEGINKMSYTVGVFQQRQSALTSTSQVFRKVGLERSSSKCSSLPNYPMPFPLHVESPNRGKRQWNVGSPAFDAVLKERSTEFNDDIQLHYRDRKDCMRTIQDDALKATLVAMNAYNMKQNASRGPQSQRRGVGREDFGRGRQPLSPLLRLQRCNLNESTSLHHLAVMTSGLREASFCPSISSTFVDQNST